MVAMHSCIFVALGLGVDANRRWAQEFRGVLQEDGLWGEQTTPEAQIVQVAKEPVVRGQVHGVRLDLRQEEQWHLDALVGLGGQAAVNTTNR